MWGFSEAVPRCATKRFVRGRQGPFKVAEVRQNGRYYILENDQKVHFEKLKLHWINPAAWIVLVDGEVHFNNDDIETETDEEMNTLSEGAVPFAEGGELSVASE